MDNQHFVMMIVAGIFMFTLVLTVTTSFHSSFDDAYSAINPNASVALSDFSNVTSDAKKLGETMENATNSGWGLTTYKDVGFGIIRNIQSLPEMYDGVLSIISKDSEGYIDSSIVSWLALILVVMFVLAIVFIVFGVFL